ncbi:MAG: DUF4252 domain-containing protein [Cruoricaptor ignavus]|nr:DUF4252 domain-containing protein [Cruoricaptor ignavus]
MKNILKITVLFLAFILQSCMVSTKPKTDFFETSSKEGSQIVRVNTPMWLAKPMMKKQLKKEGNPKEIRDLVKKISDIKIYAIQNSNTKMKEDFAKYLNQNNFEEWMTINRADAVINFQVQQKQNEMHKLMLVVQQADQQVLIDIDAKFSSDDISKLINYSENNGSLFNYSY